MFWCHSPNIARSARPVWAASAKQGDLQFSWEGESGAETIVFIAHGGQEAFDVGPEGSLIMTDGWFNALTAHKNVGGTRDSKQGAEAETCVLTFGQQGALVATDQDRPTQPRARTTKRLAENQHQ